MYPAQTSGLKSADTAICARTCVLHAVVLISDGTNAGSIVLYDNASAASGTVLAQIDGAATDTNKEQFFPMGVEAYKGIYADVTGTNAKYIVYFSQK